MGNQAPGVLLMKNDASEQILISLRRIIRAVDLHSRDLAKNYGVTGPQLVVLREALQGRESTIGQIARNVSLSAATVTDIIARLEKNGYAQRIRSTQDKRRVIVMVTPQGETIIKQTPPLLQERLSEKFAQLEDWEQTLILSSLQRIVSMLEVQKLDAASLLAIGPLTADSEQTQEFLDPPVSPDTQAIQSPRKI